MNVHYRTPTVQIRTHSKYKYRFNNKKANKNNGLKFGTILVITLSIETN